MAKQFDIGTQDVDTLVVVEKRLRKAKIIKTGEGVIRRGEVLALDISTGKLIKHVKGTTVPFTVNLGDEVDATSTDQTVFIAAREAVLDVAEVHIAADDYKGIHELYLADIDLVEVA